MATSRYANLIDDLAIEIALAENEGKSEAVVKAIEKKVFRVQAQIDKIQAKGPTAAMETLESAVKALGGVEKLTATQTQNLVRDIERLSRAGAAVPGSLEPAIASVNKMRLAQAATADAAKKAADAIEESTRRQAAAAQDKQTLADAVTSRLGLGTGVSSLGAAAGGLLAVGAMAGAAKETYDLIKASAELADTITDLAGTYQVSTDEIQTWQRIQKDTGVTVDAIGASVTAVSKILINSPDKFKEWGMDVEHLRSLQPEQLLGAMGEKLQALGGQERLAFIEDFKIANELMPQLLSGFDALREKAAGSISPLSEAELENLKETKDAITGIEAAWADMWTEVGNALGSDAQVQAFFSEIKDGMVELVKYIAEHREELALFAKLLGSAATFNATGAVGAVARYAGAPTSAEVQSGFSRTFGRGRGYTDDDGSASGRGSGSSWSKTNSEWLAKETADSAAADAVRKRARDKSLAERKAQDAKDLAARKAHRERMAEEAKKTEEFLLQDQYLRDSAEYEARKKWQQEGPGGMYASPITPVDPGRAVDEAVMVRELRNALMVTANEKKRQLDLNKQVEESLRAQGKSEEEISRIMGTTVDQTMTWSQFLQIASNQLTSMGKTGSSIGKILGGVGGIGAMFEKNEDGENAFSGGGLKGVMAGITAGVAAFDIAKTLYSMFHKTEAQKVAFDVGRDYGVKISEGLSKEIAEKSKTMGRQAASLLSLDKIVAEGGGVSGFGLDKTISKMRDLFSMLQTGKMTAEEARKPFDALFGEVAQKSISKTTGLISAQARELMALAIDGGLGSEAVKKFQGEQIDKSMVFLDRLSKNKDFKIAGEGAGAFFGAAVADAYNKMLADGLSSTDIAEKLGPQIDALRKKLDEAGVGGGAMFDAMTASLAIFTNEITGPTASAFEDLTGLMAAMFNAGTLNSSNFAGFAQQLSATYQQAVAKGEEAGMSEQQVFDALAPKLQGAWEAQQRLGTTLDPEAQALLDRALSEEKIGPEFMDPVVGELVSIGETLKVIARQGGATDGELGARFPQPYVPGLGGPSAPSRAPTDLPGGSGSVPGDLASSQAIVNAINGLAKDLAAAMASQPIDINLPVTLDGGAIAGGLQTRIERGNATGLVTAVDKKIKERG